MKEFKALPIMLLIIAYACTVYGIIPEHVQAYIKELLSLRGKKIGTEIIGPPTIDIGTPEASVDRFFLPLILLWSPYITYPMIFPPNSIVCPSCGQSTQHSYWNDGSTSATQPRLIHDLDNIVYLVSAVYKCGNKHSLFAHDESILSQFPNPTLIPFILLKRTGITRSLADLCTSLITRGMTFQGIESLIIARRMTAFARIDDNLKTHELMTGSQMSSADFWSNQLSQSPSDFILKQCFVVDFLYNELLYIRELTAIPIKSSISFDHTFRIAANIGYTREDGKWTKQYDALFVVMNEEGKIVAWQFTRGTSFAETQQLLQNIKERCQSLKTVYIDDCCKLRNKIHTLLGPHISVKLDVFHAVQRITRTLSAKCKLHYECVRDLSLAFRVDGDSNKERLCSTPDQTVMTSKLNAFVHKWKNVKDKHGVNAFTTETIHAVSNLQKHVSMGCLNDIPPGSGTNRNERFHHHINSILHRSKIGILLAYALLSVVIHSYNSSQTIKSRHVSEPITCSIFRRDIPSLRSTSNCPVGIFPKEQLQTEDSNIYWEIDVTDCIIDLDTIKSVLTVSFQKFQVLKSLSAVGLQALTQNMRNFISYEHQHPPKIAEHGSSLLQDSLHASGLKLIPILGDGNCFFAAIAENIRNKPDQWQFALSRLGQSDTDDLSQALREIFVNELLGPRRHEYEEFLEPLVSNYGESVEYFRQSSFYDSPIGNAMPLAMATALQCSIIIFYTDSPQHPRYVSPTNVQSTATAFVVYNPDGSGHYDAALPMHSHSSNKPASKCVSCRCGSNRKTSKLSSSCTDSPIYKSRCKCLKNKQACTSLCQCCECYNPHGQKPLPSSHSNKKCRIHRKHPYQVKVPNSKCYAEQKREKIAQGSWSDFETIVLYEIISKLQTEDTQVQDIVNLYNKVYEYSKASYCVLEIPSHVVFRNKGFNEIEHKIKYEKEHTFFT